MNVRVSIKYSNKEINQSGFERAISFSRLLTFDKFKDEDFEKTCLLMGFDFVFKINKKMYLAKISIIEDGYYVSLKSSNVNINDLEENIAILINESTERICKYINNFNI